MSELKSKRMKEKENKLENIIKYRKIEYGELILRL